MSTPTTDPTRRDWSNVGAPYTGAAHRPAVEAAIAELAWQPVSADGRISGPFSPVSTIVGVIRELELPRVSAFACGGALTYPDGPEQATYQLLGVEANYANGRVRLYLLDIASDAVPLAADHTPTTGS